VKGGGDMKTIVVYHSLLGTTRKYATWLGEELHADVVGFKDVTKRTFDDYDVVIVTSGTYAGKMPLVDFLKKYWEVLELKKVLVMAVGIAPADVEQSRVSYELIPEDIRSAITYFKVPGNMFGLKPAGEPSKKKLEPLISYFHKL